MATMRPALCEPKVTVDVGVISELAGISFATSSGEDGSTRIDALLMWENKAQRLFRSNTWFDLEHNHIQKVCRFQAESLKPQ